MNVRLALAIFATATLIAACGPEVDDCVPRTCSETSAECGTMDDGCGGSLSCGTCAGTDVCQANTCVANCTPRTCSAASAECGTVDDGCGGSLSCGTCGGANVCEANTCVSENACTVSSECAHDELCHADECQDALGRRYRFTIVDAEVGTRMPNGETWDAGGGAPDLYVLLGFDQNALVSTSVVQDQFSASWGEYIEETLPSGGSFYIYLMDDDLTDPDVAAGWGWAGNDALVGLARSAGALLDVTDDSGTVTVRFKVEPLF